MPIHWYDHKPLSTVNANDLTIMWNKSIPTSIHIPNNRPDIVIDDCEKRMCILINISVPQDQNMTKITSKKIQKYKPLELKLQKCWNLKKIETIPIIIARCIRYT